MAQLPQAKRAVKKAVVKKTSSHTVAEVLRSLQKLSNKRIRDELMPRYGIHTEKAFGIGMANIHKLAGKSAGTISSHFYFGRLAGTKRDCWLLLLMIQGK